MLSPFKAVRPTRDKAYLVATRSYLNYFPEELKDKLDNNPFTFLHVINPDVYASESAENRFEAVRKRFDAFTEEGVFIKETEPVYFLYQQITPSSTFEGVIGLLDTSHIDAGKVVVHENTIQQREELFANYLECTGFQAEPILVFGEASERRSEIFAEIKMERPEYEFSSTDRYEHRVWVIPSLLAAELEREFKELEDVYIADGHHRLASTKKVSERLPSNIDAQGVLCMLMGEDQVKIDSFERWFRLENAHFDLNCLEDDFDITPLSNWNLAPKYHIEMYAEGSWYGLTYRSGEVPELKPQLLLDKILKPHLSVLDPRNDQRLEYIRQGETDESQLMTEKGFHLGFRLPSVSVELLKKIGKNGGIMPPKSTYIEPKLRSGLLLHVFK
ncbi:MAG: DUF1015 domain-containing protein [Flavobacteriales bacterium]|tara:strand:+ start:3583 stop:4746 length:1164 start_codon:yes stop_codon:yes gene_type:complete